MNDETSRPAVPRQVDGRRWVGFQDTTHLHKLVTAGTETLAVLQGIAPDVLEAFAHRLDRTVTP